MGGERSLSWAYSSIGHRQSCVTGFPLWTRGPGASGVDGKWMFPGRHARPGGGRVGCLRCGGFEAQASERLRTSTTVVAAARPPAAPDQRRTRCTTGVRTQRRLRGSRQARSAVGRCTTVAEVRRRAAPEPRSQVTRGWGRDAAHRARRDDPGGRLPAQVAGDLDRLDQRWASGCPSLRRFPGSALRGSLHSHLSASADGLAPQPP